MSAPRDRKAPKGLLSILLTLIARNSLHDGQRLRLRIRDWTPKVIWKEFVPLPHTLIRHLLMAVSLLDPTHENIASLPTYRG